MTHHDNLASLSMLATIRYWWWWASHDLAYLERIEGTKGLDFDLVQSIAKDYGIARGIRKEKTDPHGLMNRQRAQTIADAVNRRRDGFLDDTGFVKLASDMRSALPDSDHFHPERIVDQYLWLSASQEHRPLAIAKTAAFLNAIGDEKRKQLLQMAEIIETNFAADLAKIIPDTHNTSKKIK